MLADYHRKFKYILVDEYQDTNTAQYMWLRLLAQRPQASTSPLRGGRRGEQSDADPGGGGDGNTPTPPLRDDHKGEGEGAFRPKAASPTGRPSLARPRGPMSEANSA